LKDLSIEDLLEAKKLVEEGKGKPTLMGCTHYFIGALEHFELRNNKTQKFCHDCFEEILKHCAEKGIK